MRQEGVADFASFDRILVDSAGFRMGPFSPMDLVGLEVAHARDGIVEIRAAHISRLEQRLLPLERGAENRIGKLFGRGVGERSLASSSDSSADGAETGNLCHGLTPGNSKANVDGLLWHASPARIKDELT